MGDPTKKKKKKKSSGPSLAKKTKAGRAQGGRVINKGPAKPGRKKTTPKPKSTPKKTSTVTKVSTGSVRPKIESGYKRRKRTT